MISFELRDSIALIRLDRPEQLNALTGAMLAELGESFERVGREPKVRAVILTGAGERAFSAGTESAEEPTEVARRGGRACALIKSCGVPVIAAVNGLAAGGGFMLVLACHLRLASTTARFSLSGMEFGVPVFFARPQRHDSTAAGGRAIEMILAGAEVSADEALRCGLINRTVAPAELLSEAEALAHEISRLAPLAIRACLEAVTRGLELQLAEGLELETELFSRLFETEDMREGTLAFLEKRAPAFKGK